VYIDVITYASIICISKHSLGHLSWLAVWF